MVAEECFCSVVRHMPTTSERKGVFQSLELKSLIGISAVTSVKGFRKYFFYLCVVVFLSVCFLWLCVCGLGGGGVGGLVLGFCFGFFPLLPE